MMSSQINNILVVIVSCLKNKDIWTKILDRLDDNVIILCGGADETKLDGKILYLNCNDAYDGLSEKMMCAYEYILNADLFKTITHIFKADDHDTYFTSSQINDIQIKYSDVLNTQDYIGQNLITPNLIGRTHHFGKVPKTSIWYNKKYEEKYEPYLGGGETYILSRKALNFLVDNKKEHIKYGSYEDAMNGSILKQYDIHPYQLKYGIKTWIG
jgi:hypothetical protein